MKTCLLIDDDRDDQEVFLIALQRSGHPIRCATASNGVDGLHALDEQPHETPDWIFLDMNMPGMNGKQCLAEIRRREYLNGVPVVIYTTSSHPSEMQELRALGASDYFTKPNSVQALSGLLADFFSKYV